MAAPADRQHEDRTPADTPEDPRDHDEATGEEANVSERGAGAHSEQLTGQAEFRPGEAAGARDEDAAEDDAERAAAVSRRQRDRSR